jgi:2'-5' RNA ligase
MHRIFIAVKVTPEPEFESHINFLKEELNTENIRWVEMSNIHVTIAFIGETEDVIINRIGEALLDNCSGFGRFEFAIRGLGIFKSINDPRVIWAGLDKFEKLKRLQLITVDGLKDLPINIVERKFTPHVTLGRVKSLKRFEVIKSLIVNYSEHEFQKVSVKELILYKSILTPTGPVYKPLTIIPL